jgi:single-strand DNA-binding protein
MANMKNRVTLIGRVGQQPEIKTFESGKHRCQFSLATNEKRKNAQGEVTEDTQWHAIILWGALAEIADKYVQKGDLCALEGKLVYRTYEDSNGHIVNRSEIHGKDLQILSPKPGTNPAA